MFQDRRLSPEHMNQFMNLYRKSTMAVAGRLLHIIPQIEQNIPEPSEQNIAYEELKKFSSAIINKAVDKTEANRFIDSLVRGRFNTIDESAVVRIPREELTAWLRSLHTVLKQLPPEKLTAHKQYLKI